jgi:hypothetical protein
LQLAIDHCDLALNDFSGKTDLSFLRRCDFPAARLDSTETAALDFPRAFYPAQLYGIKPLHWTTQGAESD